MKTEDDVTCSGSVRHYDRRHTVTCNDQTKHEKGTVSDQLTDLIPCYIMIHKDRLLNALYPHTAAKIEEPDVLRPLTAKTCSYVVSLTGCHWI